MPRRSRVETDLPKDVRIWLERALADGNFSGYEQLSAALAEKGFSISKSALHRHGQKMEATQRLLRDARMVTESLAAELGDAAIQGKQGRVLVETTRALVTQMLEKLAGGDGTMTPKDAMMLGKALAELGRALRFDQDFETKVREQVAQEEREKAASTAATAATDVGATEDQVAFIRAKILGIDGRLEHG
jgi:hypothetical protein